jgi:hypothetical protein
MIAVYVAHFCAENLRDTACGEFWQGWQAPSGVVECVAPYAQPRPHVDPIRPCRACLRIGRLRQGAGGAC